MARRHEKFSYTYGWRTAPESYQFYLNGKLINLGCNTRNKLGYMCACGDIKKAEKELKRLLRKEEKRSSICEMYCFLCFERTKIRLFASFFI